MKLQTLQCSQCGATVDAASIQGKVASCAFCDARFIVGSGEVRELSSYSLPGNAAEADMRSTLSEKLTKVQKMQRKQHFP